MAVQILVGDALDMLRTLPADSVQACVTSPPYFGLRDYGVAGQIGLEDTPEAYIARLVEVFREVRRVLRPDGTLWLNLGDSYAGSFGSQGRQGETGQMATRSARQQRSIASHPRKGSRTGSTLHLAGIKPKDLMLIPERVILALQADGWWIRDRIVWAKPNPMPSSVQDRFCPAWEPVFLLSKRRRYFFDYEAAREPMKESSIERLSQNVGAQAGSTRANGNTRPDRPMKAVGRRRTTSGNIERKSGAVVGDPRTHQANGRSVPWEDSDGKRLMRNVWTIATEPFKAAHFATFPTALAERCLLVASRIGDTVLDPFGGAGTVGLVASRLQRSAILCELNPEYAQLARERIAADAPLLAGVG